MLDSTSRSWDSVSPRQNSPLLLGFEGTQLSARRVFRGSKGVTQRIGLSLRLGVHGTRRVLEQTRRVQGNLLMVEDELDELFIQLGESSSEIVHQMKVNSTSCSYNSASRMKVQ